MPADGLFGPMSTTPAMAAAVSSAAWLQAMLDVEAALAAAEARAGVIPAEVAPVIAAACQAGGFEIDELGRAAAASASAVVPLVVALRAALPDEAAGFVHWGATSQDILDTAMMLVARGAIDLILADLAATAGVCAHLAEAHRGSLMAGRTLLQQAVPITFGLKAAGWLMALLDARGQLATYRESRLAIQFGGAVGTLAALGGDGLRVTELLARELDLLEPTLPWHTARGRVAELGSILAIASGVAAKIAADVALLSQTEVGEVAEGGAGRGRSSAMPQKRNPVGAVNVAAAARRAQAVAPLLFGAMVQEHERAAGAWQAEWASLSELFELTAGAVAQTHDMLHDLVVDVERMRANLDITRGLVMSESVAMALGANVGRKRAGLLLDAACLRVLSGGGSLREELLADADVCAELTVAEIDSALEPGNYLGATDELIARAIAAYRAALYSA